MGNTLSGGGLGLCATGHEVVLIAIDRGELYDFVRQKRKRLHDETGLGDDPGFGGNRQKVGEVWEGTHLAPFTKKKVAPLGRTRLSVPLFFSGVFCTNEGQKFVARLLVVAEAAEH